MKKSKAVLDYHDDNFAIVFAAMGVREVGQMASSVGGGQALGPLAPGIPSLRGEELSYSLRAWPVCWERQECEWGLGSVPPQQPQEDSGAAGKGGN